MAIDRWQRIKAVFNDAVERPEHERDAFVDETCGDDSEVKAEVVRLLRLHDDSGVFLDPPAAPGPVPAVGASPIAPIS